MNANQQQPQPLKMCPFILAPGVCTTLSHDLICHIYHFFGNKLLVLCHLHIFANHMSDASDIRKYTENKPSHS